MGGVVAFEMACQLRASGQEVTFLGLFDSYSPGYPKRAPGRSIVQVKLAHHRGVLSRYELPQKLAYLRQRLRHRLSVIQSTLFGWIFVALRLPMPHSIRYVCEADQRSGSGKYVPANIPRSQFSALIQPEGITSILTWA
jgi:hypothetical protein